jgi:biofilm PGA synthesis protein PgaD
MTRQRPTHPDIIYRPDLLPRKNRVFFSGITLFAWGIWVYLFLPLISVIAWWAGVEMFARFMLDPDERIYMVTLSMYLIVISGAALVIFGWSRYNLLRFQGQDRRSKMPPVSNKMTEDRFYIDSDSLDRIHRSKIMVLELDTDGHFRQVTTRLAIKNQPGNDFSSADSPPT